MFLKALFSAAVVAALFSSFVVLLAWAGQSAVSRTRGRRAPGREDLRRCGVFFDLQRRANLVIIPAGVDNGLHDTLRDRGRHGDVFRNNRMQEAPQCERLLSV